MTNHSNTDDPLLCSCGQRFETPDRTERHLCRVANKARRRAKDLARVARARAAKGLQPRPATRIGPNVSHAPNAKPPGWQWYQDRVRLLQKWANVVHAQVYGAELQARRQDHLDRHRRGGSAPCWCCSARERLIAHHVVQLQNGGSNDEDNIVYICEACHAEVHPWLRVDPAANYAPMWWSSPAGKPPAAPTPKKATPPPALKRGSMAPRLVKRDMKGDAL